MKSRHSALTIPVLFLALTFCGAFACTSNKAPTTTPPGATASTPANSTIVVVASDTTTTLRVAQDQEISAYKAGLVPAADHANIQRAFIDVFNVDKQVHAAIKRGVGHESVRAQVTAGLDALDRLQKSLHIKNETTQAVVSGLIASVKAAFQQMLPATPPPVNPAGLPTAGLIILLQNAFISVYKAIREYRKTHSGMLSDDELLALADAEDDAGIALAQQQIEEIRAAASDQPNPGTSVVQE
jgi:hypothetical protein